MADVGLQQMLDWGVAAASDKTLGKVTGGAWNYDSALAHREGIGAQDSIVGGPIALGGSADIILQSEDIIQYALRSSYTAPALTALSFAGGLRGDGRKQGGAKLNTLTLRCAVGDGLTASIEWLALTDAAYSTAAVAYDTGSTWEWFTATAAGTGASSLEVQSWEVSINNNLEHIYTLDSTTPGSRRLPDAIKIGSQEITVSIDALVMEYETTPPLLLADTLASDITCTFTLLGGTSGTDTMTIAATNLARATAGTPWVIGGGLVNYSYTFEAKKDLAALTVSVAGA